MVHPLKSLIDLKPIRWSLTVSMAVMLVCVPSFASAQQGVMTWRNGDQLKGRLERLQDGYFVWKSDLFSTALEVSTEKIQRVQFEKTAKKEELETTNQYLVITKKRNQFQGKLISLNDKEVELEHLKFGSIRLKRSEIRSITNLENSSEVFSMSSDFHKLQFPFGNKRSVQQDDDGFIKCVGRSSLFGSQIKLPQKVRIDIKLQSNNGFDIMLGLGYPKVRSAIEKVLRVEAWEDSLVLVHEDGFEPIYESIPAKQKELEFSLFWDQQENKVIATDHTGKVILETDVAVDHRKVEPGFFFRSKSTMTVKSLSINRSSEKETKNEASIQLMNSSSKKFNGKHAKSFDGKEWTISDGSSVETVPADVFRSVTFQADEIPETIFKPSSRDFFASERLLFQDHLSLNGKFDQVKNGEAFLRVACSEKPLRFKTKDLLEIRFLEEKENRTVRTPHQKLDRLVSGGRQLLGSLTGGTGQEGDVLRWKPDGARNDLSLGNGDLRIFLNSSSGDSSSNSKQFGDVLYLRNRDIVPCTVQKFGTDNLQIKTFSGVRKIPSKFIHAIELGQNRNYQFANFLDGKWEIKNSTEKGCDVGRSFLNARQPVRFNHPNLEGCKKISFDLTWKGEAALTGRFFERTVRTRVGDHQFLIKMDENGIELGVHQAFRLMTQKNIPVKNGRVRVEVEFTKGNKIHYSIDNRLVFVGKTSRRRAGRCAVQFSVLKSSGPIQVSLSNFLISTQDSSVNPLEIDADRKKHLLTIPRFRENDPNTHILVALNGDLLRGRLERMDDKFVYFNSQEQEYKFERKIISSVIWMIQKSEALADSAVKSPKQQQIQVLFNGRKRISMAATAFEDKKLIGQNGLLGECRIPIEQIAEIRQGKAASSADDFPYADWYAVHAKKPKIEQAGGPGGGSQPETKSPLIGRVAKPFELKMLDGSTFKLSDHRGKVVVLDFWATWCDPCVRSMPKMVAATKSFQPKDVTFVAVNLMEKPKQISPFIKGRKWTLPVALDSDGEISKAFGADAIPHSVIIDPKGKISYVKTGSSPNIQDTITREIRNALKK